MFHAQELGSYAQGQGSLPVFKVTARDQGHYKGASGAFVTYCNISCFVVVVVVAILPREATFITSCLFSWMMKLFQKGSKPYCTQNGQNSIEF